MNDITKPSALDAATPVSARIRARITAAGQRFHANDNIAAFIRDDDRVKCDKARPAPHVTHFAMQRD